MKIPFLRASLPPPQAWTPDLAEAYAANRFSNGGPVYMRLAATLREQFAASGYDVVLAANATSALTISLMALGLEGEIIIPAFTFPATLHAVLGASCDAVLCDADNTTWELSTSHLAELLRRPRVAAVMAVRSFGFVKDLQPLIEICEKAGRPLIVDAAAAFGSPARRHAIGSEAGYIEVVSFHATKVISAAEGAAIFAPSHQAEALLRAANFGLQADRRFGDGTNAKIDEVRCAIALASLRSAERIAARRTQIADAYIEALSEHGDILELATDVGATAWQCFPVRFLRPAVCGQVEADLRERGVDTRRYYYPSLGPGYTGRHKARVVGTATPFADELADTMLCLPIYESMTDDELSYCLEAVAASVAKIARVS
jgi:dTDP-4-amino-4,6-dideoxygalactose transaminase